MRINACAAIVDNKELLLVKNPTGLWILPGGELGPEEDNIDCIIREIGEELSGTRVTDLSSYKTFNGITPNSKRDLEVRVYHARIFGSLKCFSSEIRGMGYFGYGKCSDASDITKEIMKSLKEDRYIV